MMWDFVVRLLGEILPLLLAGAIDIVAAYLIPATIATYLVRVVQASKIAKRGLICLTFDDGPDASCTPAILDLLRQYGIRATFFVLDAPPSSPSLLQRIRDGGHDIAQHGGRHLHPWRASPVRYWIDLQTSFHAVKSAAAQTRRIFYRPAFGKANALTYLHAFHRRTKVVFWTVDPRDYNEHVSQVLADRMRRALPPTGVGAVVLLHDGRATSRASAARVTLDALRLALPEMVAEGRRFASLSEAFPTLRRQVRRGDAHSPSWCIK